MAWTAANRELISKLIATGLSTTLVFFLMRLLLKQLEPGHDKKARAVAVVRPGRATEQLERDTKKRRKEADADNERRRNEERGWRLG